jgi:hypothetical protein
MSPPVARAVNDSVVDESYIFPSSECRAMADPLTEYYDSLVHEADVPRLIDDTRCEDQHLEFKRKANSKTATLDKQDTESFSKALSGSADAAGRIRRRTSERHEGRCRTHDPRREGQQL